MWKELLGVPDVWLHDNFFELGGNSLRVMQMLPRLRNALDAAGVAMEVSVTVPDIFANPTVAGVAFLLSDNASSAVATKPLQPPLVAYERLSTTEWMPVSLAQEQMLVLHAFDEHSPVYNVEWCVRLDGGVDVRHCNDHAGGLSVMRFCEQHTD